MKTTTMQTAEMLSLVKANALMALDQRNDKDYSSLDDVLCSYYDNVRDSLIEQDGREWLTSFDTFSAYRGFVRTEAKRLKVSLAGTCCEGK